MLRWRHSICALVMLTGCFNTPTLRDGRVLGKGEEQFEVGLGFNYAEQTLAAGRETLVGNDITEVELTALQSSPSLLFGLRAGAGNGSEVASKVYLIPGVLGFGLDVGLRSALTDDGTFATALAGSVGGFAAAFGLEKRHCYEIGDGEKCVGKDGIASGVFARIGVDMGWHGDVLAIYASPSVAYVEQSLSEFIEIEGREYETEADAVTLLLGGALGLAIGRTAGVNLEVGFYVTPDGRTLWVPALGGRFGATRSAAPPDRAK